MRGRVLLMRLCCILLGCGSIGVAVGRKPAGAPPDEDRFQTLIPSEWSDSASVRWMEVEDAYKLLHQAFLGPGHAIPSRTLAEDYLEREWSNLGPACEGEVLFETLVEGGPFVRVHLRPYRDRGGSKERLLTALLRSAEVPADTAGFVAAWGAFGEAIRAGQVPFPVAAYDSLDSTLRDAGFPAIHHSRHYAERCPPAYRVLTRAEAKELMRNLPEDGHRH